MAQAMSQPADLLTALLDACRRDLVTHGEAAKLVGIRKQDFGDLVAWRMVEAAAWRVYESTFNRTFPECDRQLFRPQDRGFKEDSLMRAAGLPAECRHYTAEEAIAEPENGDRWDDGSSEQPLPSVLTRALPRDIGQQLTFDWAA